MHRCLKKKNLHVVLGARSPRLMNFAVPMQFFFFEVMLDMPQVRAGSTTLLEATLALPVFVCGSRSGCWREGRCGCGCGCVCVSLSPSLPPSLPRFLPSARALFLSMCVICSLCCTLSLSHPLPHHAHTHTFTGIGMAVSLGKDWTSFTKYVQK